MHDAGKCAIGRHLKLSGCKGVARRADEPRDGQRRRLTDVGRAIGRVSDGRRVWRQARIEHALQAGDRV